MMSVLKQRNTTMQTPFYVTYICCDEELTVTVKAYTLSDAYTTFRREYPADQVLSIKPV